MSVRLFLRASRRVRYVTHAILSMSERSKAVSLTEASLVGLERQYKMKTLCVGAHIPYLRMLHERETAASILAHPGASPKRRPQAFRSENKLLVQYTSFPVKEECWSIESYKRPLSQDSRI